MLMFGISFTEKELQEAKREWEMIVMRSAGKRKPKATKVKANKPTVEKRVAPTVKPIPLQPLGTVPYSVEAIRTRIMKQVDRVGDCWVWKGRVVNTNYPTIQLDERATMLVPRFLFQHHHNVSLGKRRLMRVCETPLCVNPEHYDFKRVTR